MLSGAAHEFPLEPPFVRAGAVFLPYVMAAVVVGPRSLPAAQSLPSPRYFRGEINTAAITEASGLVASRQNWVSSDA
jgi:hypothetical protein